MEQIAQESPQLEPGVISSYRNGWVQLRRYFLEVLLIAIISFLISIPTYGLPASEEMKGFGAFFIYIFALAYTFLFFWPIEYGISFAYLKAARGQRPEVKDIFYVLQNYVNAILANLLLAGLIIIGFFLLIVPGIVFACKLAFVPYLVVEQKMEAIQAVKESWRMTKGYALKVFMIGLLAIPLAVLGLLFMGVGIIVAIMWIRLAIASLYHAVSLSEDIAKKEVKAA